MVLVIDGVAAQKPELLENCPSQVRFARSTGTDSPEELLREMNEAEAGERRFSQGVKLVLSVAIDVIAVNFGDGRPQCSLVVGHAAGDLDRQARVRRVPLAHDPEEVRVDPAVVCGRQPSREAKAEVGHAAKGRLARNVDAPATEVVAHVLGVDDEHQSVVLPIAADRRHGSELERRRIDGDEVVQNGHAVRAVRLRVVVQDAVARGQEHHVGRAVLRGGRLLLGDDSPHDALAHAQRVSLRGRDRMESPRNGSNAHLVPGEGAVNKGEGDDERLLDP